jgi:type IV secretory pathway protease TraF
MKTLLKTILVGAVLATAGVVLAATAADPVVGTWTLNVEKSKFSPGPAPKSQTRTYSVDSAGVSLEVKGIGADGTATSQESTFKYDGKAYVMKGAADYDAISLKQVNANTVKSIMIKAGKPVGTTTRTVSAHGKVLTLSTKATDANGKAYDNVAVYDKQ